MKKQTGKRNYQKELEQILGKEVRKEEDAPLTLLLHSCCAPCSSYVLEYLSRYFEITVFYFNPNIYPETEYEHRVTEQERLILELNKEYRDDDHYPIHFLAGRFDPNEFYSAVRGLEHIQEGGERCHACFRLRLAEAVKTAKSQKFDYVTTTLTISPLKNAEKLNEIGEELTELHSVSWLPSDFKKKNGYKRSTELSEEHGLYRQDYCGCVFSKREREAQKAKISCQ